MFSEEECIFYRKHVLRALTNDNIVFNVAPVPADRIDPVAYWHNVDTSTFEEFTAVTIYNTPDDKSFYCIVVYSDEIEFDYCGYLDKPSEKSRVLSTELFITGSDEEFFQVGTVLDLSFIKEDLLRQIIQLSLMARKNKNIKEST